ncbi:MAG: GMP synthase [Congregibacter sp.]
MKIGILKTDAVRDEWIERFGEYPDMFRALLSDRDPTLQFAVFDVRVGEYPDAIDDMDAYLITGSRHGVYEDLPWIPTLLTFIRELHQRRKKLLGICFGHQAIAEALGGKAEKVATGWGMGVHKHRFVNRPAWLDDGDLEFPILVSHQDQVVTPATGCEVLGGSDFCPNGICQLGSHILTFQGHPEFVSDYSREIMNFRREIIGEACYQTALASLDEPPARERMAGWLLSFLRA